MHWCVNRWHGGTIGRHSLSHALAGVPAPSGREPGRGAYHSSGYSLMSGVAGDFHHPYGTQRWVHFTFIGGHSLSPAFARQLPQGGSREWLYHSSYRPETGRLRAIFIAPTELRGGYISPFIRGHSLSLAFARQLPQRGSRGGCKLGGLGGAYPPPRAVSQRDIPKRASCSGAGEDRN